MREHHGITGDLNEGASWDNGGTEGGSIMGQLGNKRREHHGITGELNEGASWGNRETEGGNIMG